LPPGGAGGGFMPGGGGGGCTAPDDFGTVFAPLPPLSCSRNTPKPCAPQPGHFNGIVGRFTVSLHFVQTKVFMEWLRRVKASIVV